MLFHSSIRKELARGFGATLVVLVTIVMTMMLIRTLGLASRGAVSPSDVMAVMGYAVLGHLPTILTLSLFIASVSTLSRMYRDSEMVIWFASGRGPASLLRPLLRFAWPMLLVIALLALLVWPWSNQQAQNMKDRFERRGDLERVAPGQFQESASGSRVFFVEKNTSGNKVGQNVFISTTENGKETVTSARSGRAQTFDDDLFLLLSQGQRLESTLDQPDLKISEFAEYGARLSPSDLTAQENAPAKSLSTRALLQSPTRFNLGELAWRIGLALAALNFVVLAVALSNATPRAGRSGGMLFALFSFIVYYNLLNLGQSWIGAGKVSFTGFLLTLHGGVLASALLWLGQRHNTWAPLAWLRRVRSGQPSSP